MYHGPMHGVLDALFPPRDTERVVRAIDAATLAKKLDPINLDENVVALLPYRDPLIHALIIETKYYGNRAASDLLASALAEYLLERLAEETILSGLRPILVPVPLSRQRRRERGYNQAEMICRATMHALGPAAGMDTRILARHHHTRSQTALGRMERIANVAGAFAARKLDSKHLYIVIDDVVTTGATLTEAMRALEEAGATRVIGVGLAHQG